MTAAMNRAAFRRLLKTHKMERKDFMPIKITVKKLIESWQPLQVLANTDLPPRAGFCVGRALSEVQAQVMTYEDERIKLVKQFAAKDENGDVQKTAAEGRPEEAVIEDRAAFEAGIKDLQSAEKRWITEQFQICGVTHAKRRTTSRRHS